MHDEKKGDSRYDQRMPDAVERGAREKALPEAKSMFRAEEKSVVYLRLQATLTTPLVLQYMEPSAVCTGVVLACIRGSCVVRAFLYLSDMSGFAEQKDVAALPSEKPGISVQNHGLSANDDAAGNTDRDAIDMRKLGVL